MFTLETPRLYIRPLTQEDWADTLEHRIDRENAKYIPYLNEEEIKKVFTERFLPWTPEDNKWFSLGVELKENKKVIGEIGFRYLSKDNLLGEFGYRFNRNYHSKGFATEASIAFVDKLFSTFELNKLLAICDTENIASYRVMEKLGLIKEAHYKQHSLCNGKWRDEFVYSILKHNWRIPSLFH